MIQIDMEMPKSCGDCPLMFCDAGGCYCGVNEIAKYSIDINDTERDSRCPLREAEDNSVLEDIKSEIQRYKDTTFEETEYETGIVHGYEEAISIIDKHISGKEQTGEVEDGNDN